MKRKYYLFLSFVILLFFFLGGCTFIQKDEVNPGDILVADGFNDPKTGWDTWSNDNGSMVVYQNDALRILVNEAQYDYWSRPGLEMKNVHIEVDAAKVGGPDDNDFGIICRYIDQDNFYAMLISSDGYYGILKVKEGEYSMLGSESMQFSEAIRQGDAINHLRADCVEDGLILWVNGEKLLIARDGDFSEGDVGVIAGTNDTPGVDILFDNFVVYNP